MIDQDGRPALDGPISAAELDAYVLEEADILIAEFGAIAFPFIRLAARVTVMVEPMEQGARLDPADLHQHLQAIAVPGAATEVARDLPLP